ncbi:MAG: triphosphoribosyl-dephospho-CoA synthase [Planctomycetota bacterium]|nr:triphosphoribosyl-dephospho-CoA synthase [Planctomycetota bacterium]MDA1213797.1 triphosphoribosyl-dephospho-CoA synthase [Planctomycetota bacterium]
MNDHSADGPASCGWTIFLETIIHRACVLEAAAAKPGNVHPQASFADTTYADFVRSAEIIAPILARTTPYAIGKSIYDAVEATQRSLGKNTNLGILLLLAPLCAVPEFQSLAEGIEPVLRRLTRDDAVWVYRAIRLAQPGGLGRAAAGDVADEPTGTLLEMMHLSRSHDLIAREYAEGFPIIREITECYWQDIGSFGSEWNTAIIALQLRLMASYSDSLIARKCGTETALQARNKAERIWNEFCRSLFERKTELIEFDNWLRADGNRRNPGTTADLIAGALFAAARERVIELPDLATIERDIASRSIRS